MCLDKVHLLRIQVWSGLISCCLLGANYGVLWPIWCSLFCVLSSPVVLSFFILTIYSLCFTRIPASPATIASPDVLRHTNIPSGEWTWHTKLFLVSSHPLFLSLLFARSLSLFPSSPPFPFSSQMQTIHRKQEIMASVQSARANQRASWEKPRMRGEKQPIVWRRLKSRKDGIVWRGDKSSCCHSNLN